MARDLYLRNVSPDATEEDLRKLFAVCGKVTYVHMVKDAEDLLFGGEGAKAEEPKKKGGIVRKSASVKAAEPTVAAAKAATEGYIAWLGGFALFLCAAFFVKYSIEHGLVPPALRVVLTLLAGAALAQRPLLARDEFPGRVDAAREQDVVAHRRLHQHREVASRGHHQRHLRHRDVEDGARFLLGLQAVNAREALARLEHPNILAIHDLAHEGDVVFTVTELLQGETLRDRMATAGRRFVESERTWARGSSIMRS